VGRHQHGGVEDAVLLGADQLLAVQQQERPVGPVRHLEERDAAGLAHLGNAGAVAGFLQREPVGVVEVGGEERDDGEGAVGHGLAGQDGGEELGNLGDFVQRGMGGSSFGVVEDPACIRSVTVRVAGPRVASSSLIGRLLGPRVARFRDTLPTWVMMQVHAPDTGLGTGKRLVNS
jgi:hypothetical protein